jgi:hypothetical protein
MDSKKLVQEKKYKFENGDQMYFVSPELNVLFGVIKDKGDKVSKVKSLSPLKTYSEIDNDRVFDNEVKAWEYVKEYSKKLYGKSNAMLKRKKPTILEKGYVDEDE